jgi:DNA-binding transcriptional LysR family regulator
MEWQQIVGFYHIARLGSFTRAAEATFRTQSALSQQVKALEQELGCVLVERIGTRQLRLTAAGERFLAFSEGILHSRDILVDELNELKGLEEGNLSVAAPFTTLFHLFPPVLKEYRRRFPQVQVTVLDRPLRSVMDLVKTGEVDFGLVLASSVPGNLVALTWKRVETVLIVPTGHPLTHLPQVTLEDIATYPLILPPRGSGHARQLGLNCRFGKSGLQYQVVMESSNVELSSMYVEMGLGLAFATVAPDMPILKERPLEFISLSHYFEPDYVALVMRKAKNRASYKSAFVGILLGHGRCSHHHAQDSSCSTLPAVNQDSRERTRQ